MSKMVLYRLEKTGLLSRPMSIANMCKSEECHYDLGIWMGRAQKETADSGCADRLKANKTQEQLSPELGQRKGRRQLAEERQQY
ncbi:MAG: hypothetical protein Ta2E_12250 [Mycoplasmoidaceae bacterium]|nr:MAG: hypothetical protein Ta2E_12250 [Mycoplasmoidaceae bacterium]